MERQMHGSPGRLTTTNSAANQRYPHLVTGHLNLTLLGMDTTHMLIDSGIMTDLSQNGISVRTERSLKIGMKLTLLIESPDSESDLCIPEARVEWVSEDRSGLSIQTMNTADHMKLRRIFLSTHRHNSRTCCDHGKLALPRSTATEAR